MKKFTFKGVLDGIRSSVAPQIKPDQDIVETLRPEYFQVAKRFPRGLASLALACHEGGGKREVIAWPQSPVTVAYLCNNNTAAAAAAFVGRGSGSTCATIWMSVKQTSAAAAAARRLQLVTRTSNNVLL
ncbi:syntaxin-binding protein 5 isoform X3 [Aphis craccivora]|uniref:Syntaxin-binding protein 5 isoform X3 n=1 Tax=Aphis craccivora TaxID=307492 RepID=A0A6G0ZNY2_APHCR|nr:syntaxin-binding protein 5 isoform X3 [Aphis craccivora]